MAVCGFLGLGLAYVAFENFPERRWAFVASVISIALAVLTTEFGLVFVLLAALVCGLENRPRYALWRAAPYVAFALAYAAVTVLAKHPGQYEGAAFGTMQPSLIATTWLKQLSGTLPFTFPFTADGRVTLGEHSIRRVIGSPSFWLFFPFSGLAYHWLIRRLPIQTVRNGLVLSLVGSVLIFVSPGFTAISAKYQAMLSYGVPYVQVFVQYMGLALLFVGCWQLLLRTILTNTRWRAVAQVTLAAVLAFTYASTLALNSLTVQHQNRLWEFPRHNLGDALALLELRQGETPLFVIDRPWLQRWEWAPFAFRHSKHRGDFITLSDFIKKNVENSPGQTVIDTYFIRYPVRSNQDADVYIARIAALKKTPGGVELQFTPGGARVVRFGPDLESVTGAGRVCNTAVGVSDTPLALTSKEIRPGRVATVWHASDHSLQVP